MTKALTKLIDKTHTKINRSRCKMNSRMHKDTSIDAVDLVIIPKFTKKYQTLQ